VKYYIDKVEQKIHTLPLDTPMPFSEAKIKEVSTDTLRKILHRLHDRGEITIVNRGYFKRIEPFRELIFIYGSLKKGFDNHHLLSKYTKRIGKAITIGKFGMFEDSFGNYPYLIPVPKMRIHGELYLIERKELLDTLDYFEGAPEYYERKKILVKSHRGTHRAFVYIQPHTTVPQNQKPLRQWNADTDYKVKQLDNYLENAIGA
jgi:gamma-glutamylcyclotransferase (GGCT)/AIG2-like uncharacterized protein YtfP